MDSRTRTRRDYRSGPPTLDELRARVPWQSNLVEGCAPLVLLVQPGRSVRLEAADLARNAGLAVPSRVTSWPLPGELCGAVILSDVQAAALVGDSAWGHARLAAHQLTSVQFTAHSYVDFSSWNRTGTVTIWPCVAVEKVRRELGPMSYPEGTAGEVLRRANDQLVDCVTVGA
jgi:hypothetical protein